jgi:3-hydroxyacyl-[acyl-carrier-protein] dehydratase
MSLYTDLQNSAISVTTENKQQIIAVFQFKKELDLFKGHFPENPILPGILQIEMVKYALEESFDNSLHIKSVKKTKFSNLIHPGKTVTLDIKIINEEDSLLYVKAILKVDDTVVGKINLTLIKNLKNVL